jgi:hypothetical protein
MAPSYINTEMQQIPVVLSIYNTFNGISTAVTIYRDVPVKKKQRVHHIGE